MENYPNLKQSAKLLDDYLTDGETHTIIEVIQKAQEINPNIPAHIIGSDKPNTIAVELYCKIEDISVFLPFEEGELIEVKNAQEEIIYKPIVNPADIVVTIRRSIFRRIIDFVKKMFN